MLFPVELLLGTPISLIKDRPPLLRWRQVVENKCNTSIRFKCEYHWPFAYDVLPDFKTAIQGAEWRIHSGTKCLKSRRFSHVLINQHLSHLNRAGVLPAIPGQKSASNMLDQGNCGTMPLLLRVKARVVESWVPYGRARTQQCSEPLVFYVW